MKKVLFLVFLLPFFSLADGGVDPKPFFYFYEPNLKLILMSVESKDLPVEMNKKTHNVTITNNLAIYDIQKDTVTYLFDKAFPQKITKVLLEVFYVDTLKSFEYCTENDNYRCDIHFLNNSGIAKRPVSDNILVETTDMDTQAHTLWIANKSGKGLKKLFTVKNPDAYFVDTEGRSIVVMEMQNGSVNVKKAAF